MRFPSRYWVLFLLPLAVACEKDSALHQWVSPDTTFATIPQPDVGGVNATIEQQAKDALTHGDVRRAGEFYQQLVNSRKGTPADQLRYKIGYGECLRRSGQNEKALSAFEDILKSNPGNVDASEGHALTLMAQGKSTDAGREFSDIMKVDGTRWRTLNALGILFVTKGMIPEAMAYYTEALKASADNPAVLNNVGLSQAIDHNYPRALEALKQASHVAPDERRKQVDLNLAMVQGISGDYDGARETAAKYLEGPALENNLGFYAHLAKDDALAKTYLNMALSDSATYYQRAWTNLDIITGDKNSNPVMKPAN